MVRVLFAVVSTLAAVSAEAQVRVVMNATPAAAIVGIPRMVVAEVTNTASVDMRMPLDAALLVFRSDGREPFFATHYDRPTVSIDPEWNGALDPIGSGDTRKINFVADHTLWTPAWFLDPRLREPGTYKLQLALVPPQVSESRFVEPSITGLVEELRTGGWLSNAVSITVEEPGDVDRRVCVLIEAKRGLPGCAAYAVGMGSHYELVTEIVNSYPSSTFTPYLMSRMPIGNDPLDRIELYRAAMKRTRNEELSDWYRWLIANQYQYAASSKTEAQAETEMHAARAREMLTDLEKRATVPGIRIAARDRLRRIQEEKEESEQ